MATRPIKVGANANAASAPDEALVISAREHRRRGVFFAHVYDKSAGCIVTAEEGEPCASPFLTMARRLLAAGYSPDRRIIMVHDGRNEIALASTIGQAARLAVKTAPNGRPVFVKYDGNDKREPRAEDSSPPRASHPMPTRNNAPARLATSSRSKRRRAA